MSTDKWKRENTKICQVRMTKNSEIYKALCVALESQEIAESAYIRQAVIEKLQRDGYLKAGDA